MRESVVTGPAVLILSCPEGKRVLGGGAGASSPAANIFVSAPRDDSSWIVRAHGAERFTLTGYAICAAAE
jgi:hypothetical protein